MWIRCVMNVLQDHVEMKRDVSGPLMGSPTTPLYTKVPPLIKVN